MLAENIQYRGAIFAALYTPPLLLTRDQATGFYSKVADRVFPRLELQYTPAEEGKPFKVVMKETGEGRRTDTLTVDIPVDIHQGSLRIMLNQTWPESFAVACRKADEVLDVFGESVERLGECEIVLVEVRLRAQVPIRKGTSKGYLVSKMMGDRAVSLEELGNVSFFGVHYDVAPSEGVISGPLDSPGRQVTVEPLRQEEGALYMEVMSNWGRHAMRMIPGKPGQAELVPGPLSVEGETPKPSAYLAEVRSYIEESLCPFLERTK
jgi:hypothetical protein